MFYPLVQIAAPVSQLVIAPHRLHVAAFGTRHWHILKLSKSYNSHFGDDLTQAAIVWLAARQQDAAPEAQQFPAVWGKERLSQSYDLALSLNLVFRAVVPVGCRCAFFVLIDLHLLRLATK